ncbi:MAG: SMC-Scp complex subunit ScpB [Candidatus Colwellbacteria bacterium]|nr:SMC-Scp complex subunit ScpB [Candidatus Colwellbacteria bacterium]
MSELASKIEAILFVSGSPVEVKKLVNITGSSEEEVIKACEEVKSQLIERSSGLRVISVSNSYQIVTDPALSPLIQEMTKSEMTEDLTPATLETLSLIAYIGPVTKSAVEYIRGVNSSFTIRNLLIRGLIERSIHPKRANTYLYRPSVDLIRHMGLSSIEDLPNYEKFKELKENLENKNES